MNPAPISSLKHLTSIKVVGNVLNENHVYETLLSSSSFPYSRSENKRIRLKVENTILEKVSQLALPDVLKGELSCFVKPFIIQINGLMNFHRSWCKSRAKRLSTVFWTSKGTINKKKTAELLVQDKNLYIFERFEVACMYCLEDQIYTLWQQLPEYPYKDLSYMKANFSKSALQYWVCFLEGDLDELSNILKFGGGLYELGFTISASHGDEQACRHYLKKLTSEVKDNLLVRISKHVAKCRHNSKTSMKVFFTDLLCTLLPIMNDEQHILLFVTYANSVLHCFFDWPGRNLSNIIPSIFWTFLEPVNYHYAFGKLRKRISKGKRDGDYQMMFQMFWQRIPSDQKKEIINYVIYKKSLIELLKVLTDENVRLILTDFIAIMGAEIILVCKGLTIFDGLMSHNRWDLVKFYIEKCALSKDMLIALKEIADGQISMEEAKQQRDDMWIKSCEIINQFIQECDKRKNVEEDGHSAKKLCNVELERNAKI